jgi:sugar O-acyltransferase (sialic acid O-acetyltransferase NeuD family)
MDRLVLFGGGGHAKVVLEAHLARYPATEVAVLDDDPAALGKQVLGRPVVGGRAWLQQNWPGAPVALGLGKNAHRVGLLALLRELGREPWTVIHPAAIVSPSATIGAGTFVAPGAIIHTEAWIGDGVIINTGASVDHDAQVGECAHVAPGARLCGEVRVGARTLIGTLSAVLPCLRVGADVTVGAGSVVLRDVGDGARIAGVPARAI